MDEAPEFLWTPNRFARMHKGGKRLWHLTPTVLPADRLAGRIKTLCGWQVSDGTAREYELPDNAKPCPHCRRELARKVAVPT